MEIQIEALTCLILLDWLFVFLHVSLKIVTQEVFRNTNESKPSSIFSLEYFHLLAVYLTPPGAQPGVIH